jgi:hypothetical protein
MRMEVVLLWLDELDDLFFSLILVWERARHCCLALSLIAAILPHVELIASFSPLLPLDFVRISLTGIVAWSVLTLAVSVLDRKAARLPVLA